MSSTMNGTKRVSLATTSLTAIALLVLWGASWGLSYVDLGAWSRPMAFAIAAAKGTLVLLYFMEIASERSSVRVTLAAGLTMIAVLVFFMIADVKTRSAPPFVPAEVRALAH